MPFFSGFQFLNLQGLGSVCYVNAALLLQLGKNIMIFACLIVILMASQGMNPFLMCNPLHFQIVGWLWFSCLHMISYHLIRILTWIQGEITDSPYPCRVEVYLEKKTNRVVFYFIKTNRNRYNLQPLLLLSWHLTIRPISFIRWLMTKYTEPM